MQTPHSSSTRSHGILHSIRQQANSHKFCIFYVHNLGSPSMSHLSLDESIGAQELLE